MRSVSSDFIDATMSAIKRPEPMCLISWQKNISTNNKFFTLDQSTLDGNDKLQGSGGTVTFFDKYDYVNETPYVKNYRITKKVSNKPWGVIMASAEIELNNTTKRFLPNFSADIQDNSDKPNRPIKLGIGFNGEFIKLFTGYTSRPEHQIVKRVTKIQAYDALHYLSTVKSELPAMTDVLAHEVIEALLTEQGFPVDGYDLEPSLQTPISYIMLNGKVVTDIFEEICQSEGYLLHVDEDGVVIGWNRSHFFGSSSPVWEFNYSNINEITWSSSSVINSAEVVAKPLKQVPYAKIWESDDEPSDRLIPAGQSKDIFAQFRDELGSFPAISVDIPEYLSIATSSFYSTNHNKDGSGASGSSDIALSSVYNFGDTYRMTFTNSGSTDIYITKIALWGDSARVTSIKSDEQRVDSSIEKYGINPDNDGKVFTIENQLVQDSVSANSLARMLVLNNSNPRSQLDIKNFCVPQIQLGDYVNVNISDTSETKLCSILGTDIFIGVDGNLKQTISLEERTDHTYFTLDQSALDGSDVLSV